MVELAAQIYRDYNTDGDPGSGAHKPVKSEVREWGTWVEGYLGGAFDVDITMSKSYPTFTLNKDASGENAGIRAQTAGIDRWLLNLANYEDEAGGNTGSNINILSYDDAGVPLDIVVEIIRETGRIRLGRGQLTFPSTQNPSSEAWTLDDYEEGTFTPAFSATGATFSYAAGTIGTYTKIGNRVMVDFRLQLNTSGNTLTGNALSMTGLPFAADTGFTLGFPILWANSTSSYVAVSATLTAGTSITFGGANAAGTTAVTAQNANQLLHATNGSIVRGAFHYRTA